MIEMAALHASSAFVSALKSVCVSTSVLLMLSGVPDVARVAAARTSAGRSMLPFLAMALDNAVGWYFSLLIRDEIGFWLRSCACLLCAIYLTVMTAFAPRPASRAALVIGMLAGTLLLLLLLARTVPKDSHKIDVLGLVNTGTAVFFAASPLANLRGILAARDASAISLPMVSVLTLCAASWATYGIVLRNVWMVLPNLLNFVLAAAQVGLVLALPARTHATTHTHITTSEALKASATVATDHAAMDGRDQPSRDAAPGQHTKEE